jgi:hypothetical protein
MKILHHTFPDGHTWRDIGGACGLVLDASLLAFLIIVSGLVLLVGATLVVVDFICHPVVLLLAWRRRDSAPEAQPGENLDHPSTGLILS